MFSSGGMLTGSEIERQVEKGNIIISNFNKDQLNPNSYNLKLHPQLLIYQKSPLDMKRKNRTTELMIPKEGLVLQPGVLYIGRTVERTASDKYIPMINGRSSTGRLGLSIHVCAGFGDIGFDGTWTLEITVVEPVRIYPNLEVAQVCFFKPVGKVDNLYRGRYYKQVDATASRIHLPKKDESKFLGMDN